MNLNIVIPMAGAGSRFAQQGYTFPKPLIQMPDGNPMIKMVIDCIGIHGACWYFLVSQEHIDKYKIDKVLYRMMEQYHPALVMIIPVDGITEGAACMVLLAKRYIDNDDGLLIVNSDQYFKWDPNNFFFKMDEDHAMGGILTFESWHPKWSFVQVNNKGMVIRVAEKDPISNQATVGAYWWKHGAHFVRAADDMISLNDRVNGEFYVAPVFNQTIGKVITYPVDFMAGVGTPEDLRKFELMYWLGKVPR